MEIRQRWIKCTFCITIGEKFRDNLSFRFYFIGMSESRVRELQSRKPQSQHFEWFCLFRLKLSRSIRRFTQIDKAQRGNNRVMSSSIITMNYSFFLKILMFSDERNDRFYRLLYPMSSRMFKWQEWREGERKQQQIWMLNL
jgi:hypothetical protein